ncbi:MAG: hypothetical protein AB7W59_10210 [Acidimicrobiia bacterium]
MADVRMISAVELREGDVLLFRGRHPLSQLIQFVDGSWFDHVALVDHPSGPDGPQIVEIGLTGASRGPLVAYLDQLDQIRVRRHRVPGVGAQVRDQALVLHDQTSGYAFDRFVTLAIASVARFSPRLAELDPGFVRDALNELQKVALNIIVKQAPATVERPHRMCVDLVREAFDSLAVLPDVDPDARPFLGLALPDRPLAGSLLEWASSAMELGEYLEQVLDAAPRLAGPMPTEEELRLLFAAACGEYGISARIGRDATDEDLAATSAVFVRRLAQLLGWSDLWRPSGDLPRSAWLVFGRLLSNRVLVSQSDLASTRTLRDVGDLNLSQLDWRYQKTYERFV